MPRRLNLKDIEYFKVKLASPEEMVSWSYGEVTKPETLNYRTQRPEKEGLFSERIFGPTKDYECYCGKYKKVRYKGVVCERCGVEVTRASVRRERMGHIELAAPVAHIWFLRTIPSRLSTLLNVSARKLEKVVYYAAYIVTNINESNRKQAMKLIDEEFKALKGDDNQDIEKLEKDHSRSKEILQTLELGMVLNEEDYYFLAQRYGDVFEAGRGAESLKTLLEQIDLNKLSKELEGELEKIGDVSRKKKTLRSLKLVQTMIDSGVRPEWMTLTVIPVIPPELRPMVALDGGRYATADLNDLYRRVINRNNRLKKLINLKSPDVILTNEKRMLQEAVDALIDNTARSGSQVLSARRRPLKSLADLLKGKQGRFRQNLLGKRVDYSARSVIVVGPELELDQCGLPKNLALEIFRPFVIHEIIDRGIAYNIKQANRFIEQGLPEVWAILEEVIADKMVLLNRAPTLHRLGIQAFRPLLIEDLAIRVHPLVCSAFNADFDGDQMAVHLPLTKEAQYECRTLMDASKNLLKPANGEPIVSPTQDIVLGCYYLTEPKLGADGEGRTFSSFTEATLAVEHGSLDRKAKIRVPIGGKIIETTYGRMVFNKIFPDDFPYINESLDKKILSDVASKIIDRYGIEHSHEYLDRIKNLGFQNSTLSAMSLGMADAVIPKEKVALIKEAEVEVAKIESQYDEGLLTNTERRERIITLWTQVRDKMGKIVLDVLSRVDRNAFYTIIHSKARGSWTQSNQMMGMRGLVANPRGETIELPIKSSYKEGLGVLEYFISTHGARKGLTDTALKTATAGYLTRRLVDVSQDLIVRELNCRTNAGIDIIRGDGDEYGHGLAGRLYSRTVAQDVKDGRKILVRADEIISREIAEKIAKSGVESVKVRSPITCKTLYGVCSNCYGFDLAKGKPIEVGEAIGVIAAQSIGEPGTQLTMRTFHIGGIAGVDITHGLPRVEEVFEARTPKGKGEMSEVDGFVESIEERGLVKIVKVVKSTKDGKPTRKRAGSGSNKAKTVDYSVSRAVRLFVKEGDIVERGQTLSEGPLDLREILMYRGIEELRRYVVNEVQRVYVPQGSTINDKHIEIIVRQMLSRIHVKNPGDTDFTVGELVPKAKFKEENRRVKKLGGQKAKGIQRVMGITKVALTTDSFLSAASFQETSRVLVGAAVEGKVDILRGLKENVIVGKLIPAGTGYRGIPKNELGIDIDEGSEF